MSEIDIVEEILKDFEKDITSDKYKDIETSEIPKHLLDLLETYNGKSSMIKFSLKEKNRQNVIEIKFMMEDDIYKISVPLVPEDYEDGKTLQSFIKEIREKEKNEKYVEYDT